MSMNWWSSVLVAGFLVCTTAPIGRTAATQFLFESLHGPSTTTISPYISDYRKQSRSDSRADKPDSFPGFDAAGNAGGRRGTRRRSATEFYTQLFGKIIGNIGVDNIVDKVERKHDKLQRLSRLARMRHAELGDGLLVLKGLRSPHDVTTTTAAPTTTEFVGLSLDDDYIDYDAEEGHTELVKESLKNYDEDDEAASKMLSLNRHTFASVPAVFTIPARYVSSLWTHLFTNQLRDTVAEQRRKHEQQQQQEESSLMASTTSGQYKQQPIGEAETVEPATATTYLLQPLRSIWESVLAKKSFYVNWPNPPMKSSALHATDEHAAPSPAAVEQIESMHEFANNGINALSPDGNGMRKLNQLQQSTPSDGVPATGNPNTNGSVHIIASRIRSKLVRAKLAFQNAFNKYSNIANRTREDTSAAPMAAAMRTTMRRPMAATHSVTTQIPSRTGGTSDDDATIESGLDSRGDVDVNSNTIAPGDEAANLNNNAIDANVYVVVGGGGRDPVADDVVIVERRVVNATTHIYADPQNNTLAPDETNQQGRRVAVLATNSTVIKSGGGGNPSPGSKTGEVGDDYGDGDEEDEGGNDGDGGSSIGDTFEGVGIFVLEIFGTLLGLGWGVFNHIQYLLS